MALGLSPRYLGKSLLLLIGRSTTATTGILNPIFRVLRDGPQILEF
jgi:hypothetical protein